MQGRCPCDVIDEVLFGKLFKRPAEAKRKRRQLIHHGKRWDPDWRLPRALRPRCGAITRNGRECRREALANGRCRNHGGLSSGPKTEAGKARIANAQKERWKAYRVNE